MGTFADGAGFDPLPFAVELAEQVRDVLAGYRAGGFTVQALTNPDRDEIADAVQQLLDDTSCAARVVHLISHGRPDPQADRVEVVGRCGRRGRTNVRGSARELRHQRLASFDTVDRFGG